MDDTKIYEFILNIKEKLSSIDTKVDAIRDTLKNHEHRLQKLESVDMGQTSASFKDKIVEYLVKAIIALIGVVASLSGAGAIIKQIFEK